MKDPIISNATAVDIVDVTIDNFMSEVIEVSKSKGVIVQFWAPWCGPCKQLGPVLEKVISGHNNLRLARVNIDENQQIAAQMQVQSVPTVYAIVEGRPVDGFAGAQPESAVRQFIEKVMQGVPGAVDVSPLIDAGEAALEAVQPDCEALQVDAHAAGLVRVAQLLIEQQQQVEHRHELREVVALD